MMSAGIVTCIWMRGHVCQNLYLGRGINWLRNLCDCGL